MAIIIEKLDNAMAQKKPWCTKAVIAGVRKQLGRINALLAKVIKITAVVAALDAWSINAKKFTELQDQFNSLFDEVTDPDQPIKQAESLLHAMA